MASGGGGRRKSGHSVTHLFVESIQKTGFEHLTIFLLQASLDTIAFVKTQTGNPPVVILRFDLDNRLFESLHDQRVSRDVTLQNRCGGK